MEPMQPSGSYESLFEQVEFLLKMGERAEAQRILERLHTRLNNLSEKVRTRRPELEDLRVISGNILATLYRDQKRFDDAMKLLEQLVDSTPESEHLEFKHSLATLTVDKGEIDAGLDALRELAAANPDNLPVWLSLGSVLTEQELYDEAETVLKHAVSIEADDDEGLFTAYTLLFIVYKRNKNYAAAEKVWKERHQYAIDAERETVPLYEMYFPAENYERIEYWLAKEKDKLIAAYYRAQLAQRRGDKDAQKWWKKVAAIDPYDIGHGWDMCAEGVLRSGGDPEDALEIVLESLELRRASVRGVLMMAVAQLLLGDVKSARETLQQYLDGGREDGLIQGSRIPYEHWQLFTELAAGNPALSEVESYFETTPPAEDE